MRPSSDRHVVVVGAGAGGLAAAIDLARQGLQVTLLEAGPAPGGKLYQHTIDGLGIDSGPTVFTMRWVFEGLFNAAGARLEDYLQLEPLGLLARHAWATGGQLDLHAQAARSAEAIGQFSGPAEARRFLAFCEQARKVYETLEGPYIRSSRPDAVSLTRAIGLGGTLMLSSLGPFRDLWRALARHFHDARLQQLFGRYATYCGSSPLEAPATLMLVAHVEMLGVWAVQGGMIRLAQALTTLASQKGVALRCNSPVRAIQTRNGRVTGILLNDGEQINADVVVFNGDVNALAQGLLGSGVQGAVPTVPRSERSLSAVTWSVRTPATGFPLIRHNVFFDDDYASEFADIFHHHRLPRKPTVYLCAQDRTDSGMASEPLERLLILVNAPALGDLDRPAALSDHELAACEQRAMGLMRRCGLEIGHAPEATAGDPAASPSDVAAQCNGTHLGSGGIRTTPIDFERRFAATGGALYGRASHGWMSAFAKPDASTAIEGLYVAGGSAHPGAGVPMATLSGRLAAASVMGWLKQGRRQVRVTLPRT